MNWPDEVNASTRALVERVCTEAEVEVLKLKARGWGRRRIARMLAISDTAVRDRIRNAQRKLEREVDG